MLTVQCEPKRGTEIDESCLRKELAEAGADGEMRVNGAALVVQYRWGYGRETPFPVHDRHQVEQATRWTIAALGAVRPPGTPAEGYCGVRPRSGGRFLAA